VTIDAGIIIAIIGALAGIAGWINARGKLSAETAETYLEIAKSAAAELVTEREKRRALAEKVDDLSVRIDGLEDENHRLSADLVALRNENETLRKKNDEMQAEIKTLQDEIKVLQDENTELKERLNTGPLGHEKGIGELK
jgi:chromosome segregation ATPase